MDLIQRTSAGDHHLPAPLRIGSAVSRRACAFGSQDGHTICVCHPHLHNPILGSHDDLVADGILDPDYGIEPDAANSHITVSDIAPPLSSGAEEAKAGQQLCSIEEEADDSDHQASKPQKRLIAWPDEEGRSTEAEFSQLKARERVISNVQQQIERLLDTAVALALNRGAGLYTFVWTFAPSMVTIMEWR
eukprot:3345134-Rhodomonas_salina.1